MSDFHAIYTACWIAACVIATCLAFRHRGALELCHRAYWQHISQAWKLLTFLVSASALIVMAPYTGDPTWDYFDAAFRSVFTYTSAPWAVGTLYLALRGQRTITFAFIAVCV